MSNNNNRPIKNKNESIKYKQENNNAIPFFNQGMKLFDNIKQKITQEFSRGKREGYENGGILGPNTGMQNKLSLLYCHILGARFEGSSYFQSYSSKFILLLVEISQMLRMIKIAPTAIVIPMA